MAVRATTRSARVLRKMMTPAERRLWRNLSDLPKTRGHFRRQAPIGPYIVDFANHTLRIVIEVDGAQHGRDKGVRADQVRDDWLVSQGYTVLRFWNGDVLHEMEGVISEIARHMEAGSGHPHPDPPPSRGRGKKDRCGYGSPPPRGEGSGVGGERRPESRDGHG